jgi:hypothetical protein
MYHLHSVGGDFYLVVVNPIIISDKSNLDLWKDCQ